MINYRSDIVVTLEDSAASDLKVARAAWVSTQGEDAREKEGERVQGLVKYLYKNNHMSPFEHGQFTFFVNCPIFVAREFFTHKGKFSFNEFSGRYSEMVPDFYIPNSTRPLVQTGKIGHYTFAEGSDEQKVAVEFAIKDTCNHAWYNYQAMLQMGVAREVARMCLPLNIYTSFYATANPRSVMTFLDRRTADDALDEIQIVARQMETVLAEKMPFTYEAWKEAPK